MRAAGSMGSDLYHQRPAANPTGDLPAEMPLILPLSFSLFGSSSSSIEPRSTSPSRGPSHGLLAPDSELGSCQTPPPQRLFDRTLSNA